MYSFRHCMNAFVVLVCGMIVPRASAQVNQTDNSGIIRGRVIISRADDVSDVISRGRMLNRYGTASDQPEKPFQPYSLPEKAVVYVDNVPGTYSHPNSHPELDQRDMVFRPLVLPILVGTTVDFPNSDPLFHNVFSLSTPKEFDLGRYPKGQHRSVTFDEEGVVSVYCEIHSYMFATILVLQNPYFAVPDKDGNYEISGIPPGTYQLSFWYGRKKVDSRMVTVTANQTIAMTFEY